MTLAIVLIDGNNFYASCEAVVDPAVVGRPLVVLSNNDGCIVSRSAQARALGIPMGMPYFKLRQQLERQGVVVRSSNYALYADMSQRLMTTLERWVEELEIYSIDEAFGLLRRPAAGDLSGWGQALRRDVQRRLGLLLQQRAQRPEAVEHLGDPEIVALHQAGEVHPLVPLAQLQLQLLCQANITTLHL
ncbi:MAG: hypothetical protein ACO23C_04050, partial [Prochlorococcaceae cyanobacterium]